MAQNRSISICIDTNSVPEKFGTHWTSRTAIKDCLQFVPKLSPEYPDFGDKLGTWIMGIK